MTTSATAHREAAPDAQALRYLTDTLAQVWTATPTVVWVPAPLVGPRRAFDLAAREDRLALCFPDGSFAIGSGTAVEVRGHGPQRFAEVEARLRAACARLAVTAAPGAQIWSPRFYGGFAFDAGAADAAPWTAFGDARFVLPEVVYRVEDGVAQLGLLVPADPGRAPLEALANRLATWTALLHAAPPATGGAPFALPPTSSDAELVPRLTAATAAIEAGDLEKLVVASARTLELDRAPDEGLVLGSLLSGTPSATTFAFATRGACFLGASPERLVKRRGRALWSEALAGSVGVDGSAAALLGSPKELSEHACVVQAIDAALREVADRVEHPAAPVLRTLRHVAHLCTPITAQLREEHHVVDLVARLHPTPAVGGSPTPAALAWIRAQEPTPRGWYAGPVGWVDGSGDGEFVVALRSGLLAGPGALLYAGAGVVRGSIPSEESAEIELKLATFLAALGATPR